MEKATFGGGCFWCTEAVFIRLKGVESVVSGYAGGELNNPSYEEVSGGKTGHAEVIQITFDPGVISYSELLEVFWATHNPTTLNRQGADEGTQYRSVIFYHSEEQRKQAEESKKQLSESGEYSDPIVTEIKPIENFFTAEDYHQNYYQNNNNYPYCKIVIDPKIKKLIAKFGNRIKSEYK